LLFKLALLPCKSAGIIYYGELQKFAQGLDAADHDFVLPARCNMWLAWIELALARPTPGA
jgi:hypothetical protein